MAETMEMNPATIKEAKALAKEYYYANQPVYFWGPPGSGKSDAWRQVCKELGIGFKDVRLGSKLPEDLTGLPVPDLEAKLAVWLKASFIWPDVEKEGHKGVILFDEMSDTSKAVQSVTYQIVLDRCIGEFHLPKGWYPAAAGNRREDRAAAQAMSTALANRFAHIDIVEDYACWREWANTAGISPFIIAFLKTHTKLLHRMDGSDMRAFPTPRSWAAASKFVDRPPGLRNKLIRGLVGPGPAADFETFMKGINIPDLKEILANPKGCRIPPEPGCKYALSSMLAQNINKKNFADVATYLQRPELGADFEIITVVDAAKRDPDLIETKTYVEFATRNADITLSL